MDDWFDTSDLREMGFKSVGEDVLVSKKSSIYIPSKMSIGNHVRVYDFCTLVGNIDIKDYVTIRAYSELHAGEGSITIKDFSVLSSRVTVYSGSEDYSGETLGDHPMIPHEYRNISYMDVAIGPYANIGTCTCILPSGGGARGMCNRCDVLGTGTIRTMGDIWRSPLQAY